MIQKSLPVFLKKNNDGGVILSSKETSVGCQLEKDRSLQPILREALLWLRTACVSELVVILGGRRMSGVSLTLNGTSVFLKSEKKNTHLV